MGYYRLYEFIECYMMREGPGTLGYCGVAVTRFGQALVSSSSLLGFAQYRGAKAWPIHQGDYDGTGTYR